MNVNIYIETDVKGAKAKQGHGIYVLECIVSGRPYTIQDVISRENVSANLIAMLTLIEALKRMQKPSAIRIFTCNEHLLGVLNNLWYVQWEKNGWRNAKGNIIKNAQEWQELSGLLHQHMFTVTNEWHSYRLWMQGELKKEE